MNRQNLPLQNREAELFPEVTLVSVITRRKMTQKGHGYFSADMTGSDSDQWKLQDIVSEGSCELIKSFLE